jgi:hypothetical protein
MKIPSMTGAKLREIHLQRLKKLIAIELQIDECEPITTKFYSDVASIQMDRAKGLPKIIPAVDSRTGYPVVLMHYSRVIARLFYCINDDDQRNALTAFWPRL